LYGKTGMGVRVVDASALGALIFGEPKAESVVERLADETMAAPALLWFELASICLKKIKAHPKLENQILKAFSLVDSLEIEIVDVVHKEVVQLARETGLSTYDCNYLWLARRLRGELVTLDNRLHRVASILMPHARRAPSKHENIL